ncbi:MAG: hypothetical protein AAF791_07090, partial [Bacteroidota bacterium]
MPKGATDGRVARERPGLHLGPSFADGPVEKLRTLRLPLAFAILMGVAYGVTLVAEGVGPTDTPELRWLLAAVLVAVGITVVQALRYFVLDVLFLRTQGHRAPALLHVVVALSLYFVLGLVIAGAVF